MFKAGQSMVYKSENGRVDFIWTQPWHSRKKVPSCMGEHPKSSPFPGQRGFWPEWFSVTSVSSTYIKRIGWVLTICNLFLAAMAECPRGDIKDAVGWKFHICKERISIRAGSFFF